MTTTLTINGTSESLAGIDPAEPLLQYLRASGRTGTKEGCAEGDCGACTVALVAPDGRYEAVNSCLLPVGAVAGRSLVTVEGVAPDRNRLHPVQEALVAEGGSQCGYCTPGFVMSMFAAYYGDGVDEGAVEGNLCRCTGYAPIRRAAERLTPPAPGDPHLEALRAPVLVRTSRAAPVVDRATIDGEASGPSPTPDVSGPGASTRFLTPSNLDEALAVLADLEDAMPIAGGTDLGVDITKFHRRFATLVSLERIPELQELRVDDALHLGAAVPLSRIERDMRGILPALDEMLHWFAARQVRNRATVGGNLGTASPIGDLAPVFLAFDAQIDLAARSGRRSVAIGEFFEAYRKTARRRDELIVAVRVPLQPDEGVARRFAQSYKVGKRGTDDISIVAACLRVDLDPRDRILAARLAYGGVAAVPARALEVEAWLEGRPWSEATVREAGQRLRAAFSPIDDARGSADYRRKLAGNLFVKFWHEHPARS